MHHLDKGHVPHAVQRQQEHNFSLQHNLVTVKHAGHRPGQKEERTATRHYQLELVSRCARTGLEQRGRRRVEKGGAEGRAVREIHLI